MELKRKMFIAAARECARPHKRSRWRLPWWVRVWFPVAGIAWQVRLMYLRQRITGR